MLQQENFQLKNSVYIPKKNDVIDQALAEFINRKPEHEQMKIMFLRQTEGVYQFGKKKVYIKVEKGNQILVRVGGGFMNINEFIEQYTPAEVEKIERNNVFERFQNKQAVQSISQA